MICRVAFYTGLGDKEPLVNQLSALWSGGKYMHCELVFDDVACGVWQNENVFFRQKTFGKSCWEFRQLSLADAHIKRMHDFCKRTASSNIPFNKWGMLRCTTAFPRKTDHTCYFCSELVIAALHEVGVLSSESAGSVSPSLLYDLLAPISIATMTPVIEKRIAKKGGKMKFRWFTK
jgi:hypothetical protein